MFMAMASGIHHQEARGLVMAWLRASNLRVRFILKTMEVY